MIKKQLLFSVVALVGTAALSTAQAATVLTMGQTSSTNTATVTASGTTSTTISVSATPVTITEIDPASGILTPVTASLTLSATSVPGTTTLVAGVLEEAFTGTFSITSGPINYLSGTFSDIVSGLSGGTAFTLSSAQPPGIALLNSNVIPLQDLGFPTSISFSFSNALPSFSPAGNCAISCTIASNTASVSGTFGASVVPLPAALPLFATGLGAMGLLGWRRKKRPVQAAI